MAKMACHRPPACSAAGAGVASVSTGGVCVLMSLTRRMVAPGRASSRDPSSGFPDAPSGVGRDVRADPLDDEADLVAGCAVERMGDEEPSGAFDDQVEDAVRAGHSVEDGGELGDIECP